MEAKQSKDIPERILSLARVDWREATVVILLGVGGLVAILTSSRAHGMTEKRIKDKVLHCSASQEELGEADLCAKTTAVSTDRPSGQN